MHLPNEQAFITDRAGPRGAGQALGVRQRALPAITRSRGVTFAWNVIGVLVAAAQSEPRMAAHAI